MDTFSHYHCTSEWHLAKLTGKGAYCAAIIYPFALHLSGTSGIFFASIPRLADYFSIDERTVRKAIKLLVDIGFFAVLAKEPGASVRYRVIRHLEWAKLHAGRCTEKYATPWEEEEQDRLAVELYQLSGGRFTLLANVLKGIRKTGHGEDDIKRHFQDFIGQTQPKGRQWVYGLAGKFIKYLKQQRQTEAARA
jgi:helix-turn-helix protein